MMKRLEPKILLVYGNVPDKFFKEYKNTDVIIKHYPSHTSLAFGKKRDSVWKETLDTFQEHLVI